MAATTIGCCGTICDGGGMTWMWRRDLEAPMQFGGGEAAARFRGVDATWQPCN
jgi:hypothetical protein